MSNSYFDWPSSTKRLVRGDFARAEDVNDAFDTMSAGMDDVEADIKSAIKIQGATTDQLVTLAPGVRANKVIGFDAAGNIEAKAFGGVFRGDWATGLEYGTGDTFRDPVSEDIYAVLMAHTSTTISADLAAGKIVKSVDVSAVEAAKVAAGASAAAASGSASAAAGSAGSAASAASAASGSAAAALASQGAAAASQSGAATSASNSADSALLAQQWAIKTDGPVSGGELSAKKHAQDAAASAAAAAASAGALPANTTYTWNPDGTLASSNADGLVTTYAWHADGRVNTATFPSAGKTRTETYNWDVADPNKLNSVTAVEV